MSGMFAKDTSVSVARSKAEIEEILAKYGADQFGSAQEAGRAFVYFRIPGPKGSASLSVRMTLPLPDPTDFATRLRYGKQAPTSPDLRLKLWEQACRSSWRALLLIVKAKLEACQIGISTIEREFMADIVMPDGRTIGEQIIPQMGKLPTGTLRLLEAGR